MGWAKNAAVAVVSKQERQTAMRAKINAVCRAKPSRASKTKGQKVVPFSEKKGAEAAAEEI